jgi:hypothetical protein
VHGYGNSSTDWAEDNVVKLDARYASDDEREVSSVGDETGDSG